MLDDNIRALVLSAICGLFRKRRTVGLFFRPAECFLPGRLKYAIERALFTILRQVSRTTIITILPFDLGPSETEVLQPFAGHLCVVTNAWLRING
jgi:hypothetical protein